MKKTSLDYQWLLIFDKEFMQYQIFIKNVLVLILQKNFLPLYVEIKCVLKFLKRVSGNYNMNTFYHKNL